MNVFFFHLNLYYRQTNYNYYRQINKSFDDNIVFINNSLRVKLVTCGVINYCSAVHSNIQSDDTSLNLTYVHRSPNLLQELL